MNCLRNDSIETIEQLDAISDPALLKIPNMGLPSLKALRAEVDRYLNRDPKRDFRRELPGDPAFSRAWKAVEEMGGAAATASKARADWRCLLGHPMQGPKGEIGRASCRERVCQYVEIWVVAVSLKKKNKK